jgi:hypothetical protein
MTKRKTLIRATRKLLADYPKATWRELLEASDVLRTAAKTKQFAELITSFQMRRKQAQ